jgi:hypothetical protein
MQFFKNWIFRVLFLEPILLIHFFVENQIGDKGAESIAEALKVNATLQDLVLYGIFSDFVHLLFQ